MPKKDSKKRSKKDQATAGAAEAVDAVRAAVERTFAVSAEGARSTRGRAKDVTSAANRIREVLEDRVVDELKGLRSDVEGLTKRIAALEVNPRGGSSAGSRRQAASKPFARRGSTGTAAGTKASGSSASASSTSRPSATRGSRSSSASTTARKSASAKPAATRKSSTAGKSASTARKSASAKLAATRKSSTAGKSASASRSTSSAAKKPATRKSTAARKPATPPSSTSDGGTSSGS